MKKRHRGGVRLQAAKDARVVPEAETGSASSATGGGDGAGESCMRHVCGRAWAETTTCEAPSAAATCATCLTMSLPDSRSVSSTLHA